MNYKERLKEYVEIDHIYEQYKDGDIPNPSDFEEYVIQHCKDIEDLLDEVELQKERIEYLERSNNRREETILDLREENVEALTKIDKAIEYIEEHRIKNPYHYEYNCFMGNARASDLLEILKDSDVDV